MPRNAVVLLILALSATSYAAEDSTWVLQSRELPAPLGVSDVLRDSIAGTPQPDIESSSTSPQTDAEWEALISSIVNPVPLQLIGQGLGVEIDAEQIADVKVYRVTPPAISPEHEEHLFLYAHGGAYVFNGGDAAVSEAALVSALAGMEAIAIDYRMPPSDPFPAAVDDFIAVYLNLIESMEPTKIAVGGSSAGAGLALAALHKLKQLNAPLPGAVYAGSPWADLTKTGDTMYANEGIDRILVTYDGYLGGAARLYANGEDLTDPLLSPVYGEFSDFPPTIFVSGTRDLFLSDTVRTHRKMRAAGVTADLHVYEAMSHTGYGFMRQAPESNDWYQELINFLKTHLQ
ncbi:MAG: alpha/beta hydrolase [Pseudomonadales bacterium]|nr:alpha/beta hydrolase [Pseudomonadales bacterium]